MLSQLLQPTVDNLPVSIKIPSGSFEMASAFVFDHRINASEVRIEGEPGTVIRRASSSGGGRRLAVLDSEPAIFTILPRADGGAGARVFLSNLIIQGKIKVQGGSMELNNCTLDGQHTSADAASAVGAIGVTVSGGSAKLNDSRIVFFEGGGAKVNGSGNLDLIGSVVQYNGRSSSARFGGVEITGGLAVIANTIIEQNGYVHESCIAFMDCVRGGGVRLISESSGFGRVELKDGTQIKNNQAYAGRSIFIDKTVSNFWSGRACTSDARPALQPLTYELPAPPAHFVVIMDKGSSIAEITGGLIDEHYPFECAPGKYGADMGRDTQATPRCSGPCPAGRYCPLATVEPIICSRGTYCPQGSDNEINCPEGTYGLSTGLSALSQCSVCQAGTHCPEGSAAEIACAPGSYAATNQAAICTPCEPGRYQDQAAQANCKSCIPGHYCTIGSAAPVACPAGYHAAETGLNTSSQCKVSTSAAPNRAA